jgi:hypothetical protein
MKLATATIALALIAAPAFAQSASTSDQTTIPSPRANPNVDSSTAASDTARQNYYQDKLDAATAQSQADSALANRDAAQLRAQEDRDQELDAQGR